MYGHARPDLTSWRKRGDNSILLTAVTTIAYCMYVNIAMYTGAQTRLKRHNYVKLVIRLYRFKALIKLSNNSINHTPLCMQISKMTVIFVF